MGAAVFGHRPKSSHSVAAKGHESAVSLKRKEMERMRREMATGKVEGAPGSKKEHGSKSEADSFWESDFNAKQEAWEDKKKGIKRKKDVSKKKVTKKKKSKTEEKTEKTKGKKKKKKGKKT